jgi:hypothetical protein
VRRIVVPGRHPGRRVSADRLGRRRGRRGAPCAGGRVASAVRRRFDGGRLSLDQVGALDGGLCSLADPDRWLSYDAILDGAQRDEISAEASAPPPAEAEHWSMHSFGALFCEVRVSAVTGETRVSRFPRVVRLRPRPQPQDHGWPVPRRHHYADRRRADGGDPVR